MRLNSGWMIKDVRFFCERGCGKQHAAACGRMIIEAIRQTRSRVALEIDDIEAHEVTSLHVAAVERLLNPRKVANR